MLRRAARGAAAFGAGWLALGGLVLGQDALATGVERRRRRRRRDSEGVRPEFQPQSVEEAVCGRLETGDILLFEPDLLSRPWSLLRCAERYAARAAGGTEWSGTAVVLRDREEDLPYVLEHRTGEGFRVATVEERVLTAGEPQIILRQLAGPPRTHEQLDAAEAEAARLVVPGYEPPPAEGGDADTAPYDCSDPDSRNAALGGRPDPARSGTLDAMRAEIASREVSAWKEATMRAARLVWLPVGARGPGAPPSRVADDGALHYLRQVALPKLEAEREDLERRLADRERLARARGSEDLEAVVRHRVSMRAQVRRAEQRAADCRRQAEEAEARLREAATEPAPRRLFPAFPSTAAAASVLQAMGVLPRDMRPDEYLPLHFVGKAPLRAEGGWALGVASYITSRDTDLEQRKAPEDR